jgi:hypothetical protein
MVKAVDTMTLPRVVIERSDKSLWQSPMPGTQKDWDALLKSAPAIAGTYTPLPQPPQPPQKTYLQSPPHQLSDPASCPHLDAWGRCIPY